jgi:MFS family permease
MACVTGRLRDDGDFRRYWTARQISTAGSRIGWVAVPVLVYRLSESPSLTALCTIVNAVPYVLFGLVSGAVADRRDRRRIMVASDVAGAVLWATVPLLWWADLLHVGWVLLVVFLVATAFTFFEAGHLGGLPALVGRERVGQANAAIWGFVGVIDLVAPMIAALALSVVSPVALIGLNAVSFAASAVLVAGIGRPLSADFNPEQLSLRGIGNEIGDGLGWLWRHARVRATVFITTMQSVAGGGFLALVVPWSEIDLGVGTSGWRFGAVLSAWGVGAIIASLITPRLLARRSSFRIMVLALPWSLLAGLATSVAPNWTLAAGAILAWGVSYELVSLNAQTYRQETTPDSLQGRVNTVGRILSYGLGWTAGALVVATFVPIAGVHAAMTIAVLAPLPAAVYVGLAERRAL